MAEKRKRIRCPYCGYCMPIYYNSQTNVKELWVKCKGRNCKKIFEIKVD